MNTPLTPEQERFARAVLEMPDFPATVVETMLAADRLAAEQEARNG